MRSAFWFRQVVTRNRSTRCSNPAEAISSVGSSQQPANNLLEVSLTTGSSERCESVYGLPKSDKSVRGVAEPHFFGANSVLIDDDLPLHRAEKF
jgi:hypothetical protein